MLMSPELELANESGTMSEKEYKILKKMIKGLDDRKDDFGVKCTDKALKNLTEAGASDWVISVASVAGSTVRLNLDLAAQAGTARRRRRRLWIALADIAGGIIGGVVSGGGGAVVGGVIASGIADNALD